jgi:acetolactate synthase-1/2/3 large subunit
MKRPLRWTAVEQLAQTADIPALPMESPRGINDPWLHQATTCLERANLVLLVGKKPDFTLRFGQPPFFSDACRFIQIDTDEEQFSQDQRVVLKIKAESVGVLKQLQTAAQSLEWTPSAWRQEVEAARNATSPAWEGLLHSPQQPIHPLRLCRALRPFLGGDAIFISDGGEVGQWVQAGLESPCRLINGPAGSIGSALPMGLGAKLAFPQRPVFVVLGDGAMGYHLLEFDTALRYGLPIIAIVGNDACWNAEYQLQIQHYGADRLVGCELALSRYDKMVEALGGHGEFVEQPEDLELALESAVESGLPACVNVVIERTAAPTFR